METASPHHLRSSHVPLSTAPPNIPFYLLNALFKYLRRIRVAIFVSLGLFRLFDAHVKGQDGTIRKKKRGAGSWRRHKSHTSSFKKFPELLYYIEIISWFRVRLGPIGTSITVWSTISAPDNI
jgi:hypothetical protein